MKILVLILAVVASFKCIESTATIHIELLRYQNPDHRMSNGRCCEQGIEPICKAKKGRCENCTLECDNLFNVTLHKHINKRNNVRNLKTTLFTFLTGVLAYKDDLLFPSNLTTTRDNPILHRVEKYTGQFTLDISSFDEDDQGIDFVDSSKLHFNSTNIPPNVHNNTNIFVMTGKVSFINVSVWVQCDPDFFTPTCDVYCKTHDDVSGHYTCDTNGQRQCMPGWLDINKNCTLRSSSFTLEPSLSVQDASISIKQSVVVKPIPTPIISTISKLTTLFNSIGINPSTKQYIESKMVSTSGNNNVPSTTTGLYEFTENPSSPVLASTPSLQILPQSKTRGGSIVSRIEPYSSDRINLKSTSVTGQDCQGVQLSMRVNLRGQINKNIVTEFESELCVLMSTECFSTLSLHCKSTEASGENVMNTKNITVKDVFTNRTHFSANITFHLGKKGCQQKQSISECIEKTLLSASNVRKRLGVETLELCNSKFQCQTGIKEKEKKNGKKKPKSNTAAIVISVCIVVTTLAILIVFYLYRKKKVLVKIHSFMEVHNESFESSTKDEEADMQKLSQ